MMTTTRRRAAILLAMLAISIGGMTASHAADEPAADTYVPTVLVTGGNRGIGLELARQYAARGWRVIGTARKPAEATELNALAAASKGRVVVEALDVMDLAAIDALAKKYEGQPVDILFNNAGVTGGGENQLFAKNMKWELFDVVFQTNVVGPLKMAEAFLPNLLAGQQKKISNVSSSQGSVGSTKNGMLYIYRSSKAALNMVMVNVANQLKPRGIAVALIDPGPVDTDMMKSLPKKMLRPVSTAGSDLIRITDQLSMENTGTFWTFDGTVLPW
ncbi:MAG: SDR family oxidoreductase [Gammaproteobacteria bacterium]|nr:SDR family oxidoreductase [Gammaproteobacteria bacterium]